MNEETTSVAPVATASVATSSTSGNDTESVAVPEEVETPEVGMVAANNDLRPTKDPARGQALYAERCAICHGADGRGSGPIARFIDPRPQDLTTAKFKLHSTETGELPNDLDLFRTITRGIRGTAMVGWAGLPAADRWHLVDHVKSLSPDFAEAEEDDEPFAVVQVPQMTPASAAMVARGEAVYLQMECDKCHGVGGRGDGPSAESLRDYRELRIYPFDMTRGWKLKNGARPQDIYLTLLAGLGGTPMPSYDGVLSERDTWALVHYVRSLFRDTDD